MSNSNISNEESASANSFDDVGTTFSGGIKDPYPFFAEARRTNPVMHGDILAKFGIPSRASAADGTRPVVSLFRYRDIMHVLTNPETFTSGLLLEGLGAFLGRIVTGLDGDEHRRVRALLQPAFAPSVVKKWDQDLIRPTIMEMLDDLAPLGRADLLRDFALHFPVRVIYSILGFPQDKEAIERFSTWALAILAGPQVDPKKAETTRKAAFKAAQDLYDHLLPIIAQRRATNVESTDMIGYLLGAEFDGEGLDDSEIASFIRMLLPAAAETTTRSFANMMALLLQDPALMAKVRSDRKLIPSLINETMRFEGPIVFLARQAAVDTEIGGVAIPAGTGITLAMGSGNRDEDAFENAGNFDIARKAGRALGFGYGVHMCIGMAVAKAEMQAALNALFDRFPTLQGDGPAPEIVGAHFRCPSALPVRWS